MGRPKGLIGRRHKNAEKKKAAKKNEASITTFAQVAIPIVQSMPAVVHSCRTPPGLYIIRIPYSKILPLPLCITMMLVQSACSHQPTASSAPPTLANLREQVVIPSQWHDLSLNPHGKLQLFKIREQSSSSSPVAITHSVVVNEDCTWKLHVHGHHVHPQALSCIPAKLQASTMQKLLSTVGQMRVCAGHPDMHFLTIMEAKNGIMKSANGNMAAYVDDNASIELNGVSYSKTLRSSDCHILSSSIKCPACVSYRRSMYHRWMKQCNAPSAKSSSHVNNR